jgi:soluble lytic murein transglycosylase
VRRLVVTLALLAALAAGVVLVVVSTSPPWYERVRYPLRYTALVREQAREKGLDPALVAAVIYQESRFRADARSSSGAIGLMQLQPQTARGIALRTGGTAFRVSDLTNPTINVRYGAWYLQHLVDKYGDERLALAAYNAGQGHVDSWLADGAGIEFPETRAYVSSVAELKRIYRDAWGDELYGRG